MEDLISQIVNIFQNGELTSTLCTVLGTSSLTGILAIFLILLFARKLSDGIIKIFGTLILICIVLILLGYKGSEIGEYFLGIPGQMQDFFNVVFNSIKN